MQALPTGSERSEHWLLPLMGVFVNCLSPFEGLKYVFPYEGGVGQKEFANTMKKVAILWAVIITAQCVGLCFSQKEENPNLFKELFRSGIMLGKSAKVAISEGTEQFIDGVSNTARDMKGGLKEANSVGELAFSRIFSPFSQ
ncbi:unnamed protein product [Timema podura]|uniref:Uncharacterized protein n=1 Tax=Timema podura TaxID=61482 RepID=A0ABN7NTN1_TIMPD|nr:unnamed protein product [Timema podura]